MAASRRLVPAVCWLLAGAALLPACSREPPWFAPAPPPTVGDLAVVSDPAGAVVWLDGLDTGRVTPDTLRGVAAGCHVVRVRKEGWCAAPESLAVDVPAAGLAQASFTLAEIVEAPPRIVLLEGFSNVSCTGCPAMAATLQSVMTSPGYGTGRVLLIKYAVDWPLPSDPHYLANPADNAARRSFYQSEITGVPVLFLDGVRAHGATAPPPDAATLKALVDAAAAGDPGFAVEVAPALGARGVNVAITLRAVRAVDNPDAALHAALVENPVQYASPPGNQGETEFHWIMRDFATLPDAPLPLAAGAPAEFAVDLTRNDAWVAGRLGVIAFVQDTRTRAVLQAGFAPVAIASAASD